MAMGISSASAQVVWGVRVGASMPTMTASGKGVESESINGIFSIEVGPTLYYSLKNNFYINSGIMFSRKKFEIDMEEDDYYGYYTWKETLNTNYLEIPVYLGYAIPLGGVQTYLQAGPYLGFKLSESYTSTYDDGETYPDAFNSLNAGLGIMYGINIKKFKIEAGYQYGLANIFDWDWDEDEVKPKITLSSFFVGVSYVF